MSVRLSLEGVHTHIGRYHILQGVDFEAPEGATTMLLGRNGAGKTTTLRTIMGLWRASKGAITLGSTVIGALAPSAVARAGRRLRAGDDGGVLGPERARESVAGGARGTARRGAAAMDLRLLSGAQRFWLSRAGSLSGGQKQMLSIARAIVEPRRLLLIDEPTKGLAPAIIGGLIDCLNEIKRTGVTSSSSNRISASRARSAITCASWTTAASCMQGAMADLAADAALQGRLLGLSLDAHQ